MNTETISTKTTLSRHITGVFAWMFLGLLFSAAAAYMFAFNPNLLQHLINIGEQGKTSLSGLGWITMLAPLGFVMVMSFGYSSLSTATLRLLFVLFAFINGVSLSFVVLAYTPGSLLACFVSSALMFAGAGVYGYLTKKDLTKWGNILFMGLIGILGAMLLNFFLGSAALDYVISIVGVIIFTALTAYDVQKIKEHYYSGDSSGKSIIMSALTLYLDFINLFLFILKLFGAKSKD